MISLDKLVEVGISSKQSTDLSAFFSNVGYIGDFTEDNLVDGFEVPENRKFVISDMDGLNSAFKPGTAYYEDLQALLMQKNNSKPNQGGVGEIHIYQKIEGETTFADAFNSFFKIDADWSQLFISSNDKDAILAVAEVCEANNRLFVAQTEDEDVGNKSAGNVAETLMKSSYANTKLLNHPVAEGIDGALESVMANDNLGSVGDLYSQFSGITPQEYSATQMSNFDAQNVAYYSTVNAVNGGGVEQYGKTILYGNVQSNGEITKRRYIRFAMDYLLKAKSLDFLVRKLSYQESSNNILEGDLKSVLISGQSNDLIVQDSEEENGFYLKCMPLSQVKKLYPNDYANQVYHAQGWYKDALIGTKIFIDLTINPSDAEKSIIEI